MQVQGINSKAQPITYAKPPTNHTPPLPYGNQSQSTSHRSLQPITAHHTHVEPITTHLMLTSSRAPALMKVSVIWQNALNCPGATAASVGVEKSLFWYLGTVETQPNVGRREVSRLKPVSNRAGVPVVA